MSESALAAGKECNVSLTSFIAFPTEQPFPHYILLVEFASLPGRETIRTFARGFDRELSKRNVEYGSKRSSLRLAPPEVWLARAGEFEAWRRRRVASGANDDQLKERHLTRSAEVAAGIEVVERFHED